MSYYNDSFALALEQQSNDLDNMLAELNSYNSGEVYGALESVQNTVENIYDTYACDTLLEKLDEVTESYNLALKQMKDVAEMYQYTGDKNSTIDAMIPAQEPLKEIYSNITGYAPEGFIDQDMIGEIRDFLTGSKEIIESRMYELGGYAGESYYDYDEYVDYATESYDDINYPLCEAYDNMNLAFESYYDCMEAVYAEYGYAFEAEASGAEKAKKEGLFTRMKNSIKSFCEHMANTCRTKRDSTQNKALKGIYNSFYGIFMRLSGQADQLREERAAEKLRKEAEKQKDELNKQVENAGGNSNSTNPEANSSSENPHKKLKANNHKIRELTAKKNKAKNDKEKQQIQDQINELNAQNDYLIADAKEYDKQNRKLGENMSKKKRSSWDEDMYKRQRKERFDAGEVSHLGQKAALLSDASTNARHERLKSNMIPESEKKKWRTLKAQKKLLNSKGDVVNRNNKGGSEELKNIMNQMAQLKAKYPDIVNESYIPEYFDAADNFFDMMGI